MSSPDAGEDVAEDVAPSMGEQEAATVAALNEPGWRPISVSQTGPDGTEILAVLFFYACPVCAAVVTPPFEDNDYLAEHATYHLTQARRLDSLVGGLLT